MNSEELVKELDKRLRGSGIITLVQDFARSNPNYWTKCKNSDDVICSCGISIACVNAKEAIPNAVPFVSVDIGSFDFEITTLWDHTFTGGSLNVEVRKHE